MSNPASNHSHRRGLCPLIGRSNDWCPPQEGDSRSPCPALNTLANHGYLYVFLTPSDWVFLLNLLIVLEMARTSIWAILPMLSWRAITLHGSLLGSLPLAVSFWFVNGGSFVLQTWHVTIVSSTMLHSSIITQPTKPNMHLAISMIHSSTHSAHMRGHREMGVSLLMLKISLESVCKEKRSLRHWTPCMPKLLVGRWPSP